MLRRATFVAAAGTAGLVVGAGVVPAMSTGPAFFAGESGSEQVDLPSRTERLIEEHGCWTGAAPGATVPGRAVVTLPGESVTVTASSVGFDLWLGADGEPGTGDERPGRLHAFCP